MFRGRARRKEFWDFALINCLLCAVAIAALKIATGSSISSGVSFALAVVAALYAALVLVPALVLSVRRNQGTHRPGWGFTIPWLPLICLVLAGLAMSRGTSTSLEVGLRLVAVLYIAAAVVPALAVSVRRLHDTNRSGWWLLFGLVPAVGGVVLIVFYAQSGQPGENRYGPDPKADTNSVGRGQAAVARCPNTPGPLGPGTAAQTQWLAGSTGKALAVTATPGLAIPAQATARAQSTAGEEVQTAQPEPSTPFGTGLGGSNPAGGILTPSAHNRVTAAASGLSDGATDLPGMGGIPPLGVKPRAGEPSAPVKPLLSKATAGTGAAWAREPLDAQHKPAPRQGQRSEARTALFVLAGVICLVLGLTVWPTIYRHDHANGLPVRTNRITGVTQVFALSGGWETAVQLRQREIQITSNVFDAPLPGFPSQPGASASLYVDAKFEWVGDTVFVTFQNSTDFDITEITVEMDPVDGAANTVDRKTRYTAKPSSGSYVAPVTTGHFKIYVGHPKVGAEPYFQIVGGKGFKS